MAFSRMVTTVAAAVELNCSLPTHTELTRVTNAKAGVAADLSVNVTVHHYVKVASTDTFSSNRTLLPYTGKHGGDVMTVISSGPPASPPTSPPLPPPPPPKPPGAPPPATKTCYQIKKYKPDSKNAMYDVDMDDNGNTVRMYCHMENYGGGWTLIARLGPVCRRDTDAPRHPRTPISAPSATRMLPSRIDAQPPARTLRLTPPMHPPFSRTHHLPSPAAPPLTPCRTPSYPLLPPPSPTHRSAPLAHHSRNP